MFCHKCGAQIAEGAAFCHKCGAKVIANTPVEQPAAVPHSDPAQQSPPASMNDSEKKKSKLTIIPIVAACAIILIVLVIVGSKGGSSNSDSPSSNGIDVDPNKMSNESELFDATADLSITDEVLYNGIPVSQLLGLTPDEVIDVLGNPSYKNDASLDYTGIEFVLYGDNNTVGEIHGDPQFFTMNDQTLDKGYEEIIQMLGEADYESDSKYSVGLWYDTNNYQMYIFVEEEEDCANQIDFLLPTGDDDYSGDYDYDYDYDYDFDYASVLDLSLVGRWRAYDGGYVEFDGGGGATVSLGLTPYGNLRKPDFVTWEASNGRIFLTSHFSEVSTYEIKDDASKQTLSLPNTTFLLRNGYRTEFSSSLVGTWKEENTFSELVLLPDGTGISRMLTSFSSLSMDRVPISWSADDTSLRVDWTLQTVYDYSVYGDMLTIFFSNGSNVYQRVGN